MRPLRAPLSLTYTSPGDSRAESEAALARLVNDIAARLRPVCAAMPDAAFDALVHDIAQMKLRWAARE